MWGGAEGCEHKWEDKIPRTQQGGGNAGVPPEWQRSSRAAHTGGSSGQFCLRCRAWRGSLGLEPTPELYVQHIVEIFREVRRTLRSDSTCWINLGDSYNTSPPGNKGFHYGKGRRAQGALETGHKHQRRNYGNLKPKDLVGIPWMVAFALHADGWWLRSDIIWQKPNCMPESVRDRPTKSHEYIFLLTKNRKYYYDQDAVRELHSEAGLARSKYAFNAYTGVKTMQGERLAKTSLGGEHKMITLNPAGRNRRTVWTIPTKPFKEAHFATFPPKLIEPCIKAGTSAKGACPECGKGRLRVVEKTGHVNQREPAHVPNNTPSKTDSTGWAPTTMATDRWQPACDCNAGDPVPQAVLDPFMGAGTTAVVALQLGRDYFGIEINPEYCEMARQRIAKTQPPLFVL